MKIKPLFHTIEDACKRTGYSETELFTICCQGDISLCYLFNKQAVAHGVIQISGEELEKLPYCEGSEDFKNLEGNGCFVQIREVSLQDAPPIFCRKERIERFRQEKYHECLWYGLMKIPSKFIRHDGYVLAEWLAPYGFDGLRIVYRLHNISAEKNNEIVKVIPSAELGKLMSGNEGQQSGDVGSDDVPEYWGQKRSAELYIRSVCKTLGQAPEDWIKESKEDLLKSIKALASMLRCTVKKDSNRMSYGDSLDYLQGIEEGTAKDLLKQAFGLVKK